MLDLTDLPILINIIVIFGILILLISLGMWIAIALATTGILTLVFLAGGYQHVVDGLLFNSISNFILVAVPMFIFLGEIILESGLNKGLYTGVSKWTSIMPSSISGVSISKVVLLISCINSLTIKYVKRSCMSIYSSFLLDYFTMMPNMCGQFYLLKF